MEQLALVAQAQARTRMGGGSPQDRAQELEAWHQLGDLVREFRAALDHAQAPTPA